MKAWRFSSGYGVSKYTTSKDEFIKHCLEDAEVTVNPFRMICTNFAIEATKIFIEKVYQGDSKKRAIFSQMRLANMFETEFRRIGKSMMNLGCSPNGRFFISAGSSNRYSDVKNKKPTGSWLHYIGTNTGIYKTLFEEYPFFKIVYEADLESWECTENRLLEFFYIQMLNAGLIKQSLPVDTVYTHVTDSCFTKVTILEGDKAEIVSLGTEEKTEIVEYKVVKCITLSKPTTRVIFTRELQFNNGQNGSFGTPIEPEWSVKFPMNMNQHLNFIDYVISQY